MYGNNTNTFGPRVVLTSPGLKTMPRDKMVIMNIDRVRGLNSGRVWTFRESRTFGTFFLVVSSRWNQQYVYARARAFVIRNDRGIDNFVTHMLTQITELYHHRDHSYGVGLFYWSRKSIYILRSDCVRCIRRRVKQKKQFLHRDLWVRRVIDETTDDNDDERRSNHKDRNK